MIDNSLLSSSKTTSANVVIPEEVSIIFTTGYCTSSSSIFQTHLLSSLIVKLGFI